MIWLPFILSMHLIQKHTHLAIVLCGSPDEGLDLLAEQHLGEETNRHVLFLTHVHTCHTTHLGQAPQHTDDCFRLKTHANCCVQRVWSQLVLVDALGTADRLGDGDEEVVGLLVEWGVGLEEDAAIGGHPEWLAIVAGFKLHVSEIIIHLNQVKASLVEP